VTWKSARSADKSGEPRLSGKGTAMTSLHRARRDLIRCAYPDGPLSYALQSLIPTVCFSLTTKISAVLLPIVILQYDYNNDFSRACPPCTADLLHCGYGCHRVAGGQSFIISSEAASNPHTKRTSPPRAWMATRLRLTHGWFGACANFLEAELGIRRW
jgi:hypothetical protein